MASPLSPQFTRQARVAAAVPSASLSANSRPPPRRRAYDVSSMLLAQKAVVQHDTSIRHAAESFHVPRETLRRHLQRSSSLCATGRPSIGLPPALSAAEEDYLVQVLVHSAQAGYPLTMPQFQEILKAQFPGRVDARGVRWQASSKWMYAFLRRHHHRIRLSDCVPVKHTPAQASIYPAVRNTYSGFNKFLANHAPKSPIVFAYDETNINLTCRSAAHQKVISAVNSRPLLYVCDQDRYLTLCIFICEDGSCVCPVLLHPQESRIPAGNKAAWDDACGTPDTLHIAAGRSAFMSSYLFHVVFEHFAEYVRCVLDHSVPVVCLLDGCPSHYNPRTCLALMELNIYLFVYESQITKFVAPPDDESVFGAFQRRRRQLLGRAGGASTLATGIASAANAYRQTLTPANIKRAFQRRGFSQGQERLRQQARVKAIVLQQQRAALWLQAQGTTGTYGTFLSHLPFNHQAVGARHLWKSRCPLGPAVPPTGIINSRRHKFALVRKLRLVVEERRKKNTTNTPIK